MKERALKIFMKVRSYKTVAGDYELKKTISNSKVVFKNVSQGCHNIL